MCLETDDLLLDVLDSLGLKEFLKDELNNPSGHPSGDRQDIERILKELVPVLDKSLEMENDSEVNETQPVPAEDPFIS